MSGRIRTLKPEWLEDELLASASDAARTLSVALILMADDYGRGRGSNAEIAMTCWRFEMAREDGVHAPEVLARASRAFRELLAMRFVERYQVDGQTYFAIRNWSKHQKVDKPSRPRIPEPPPPESPTVPSVPETLASPSRDSREPLASTPEDPRARSGPPTSDLDLDHRPGPGADPRDTLASAWRVGFVRRFERIAGGTHGGPAGAHMAALIDAALAQRDPAAFVERSLDGFFSTPRMASMRPPFAPRWLAEDPVGYAATSTTPSGASTARAVDAARAIPRMEVP